VDLPRPRDGGEIIAQTEHSVDLLPTFTQKGK